VEDVDAYKKRVKAEMHVSMAEKRMALDMIEGFAVALKHHLRGEFGMYYEDLYYLLEPLHNHAPKSSRKHALQTSQSMDQSPLFIDVSSDAAQPLLQASSSESATQVHPDQPILPINSYGTFDGKLSNPAGGSAINPSVSSLSNESSQHDPPTGPLRSHSRQHILQPAMIQRQRFSFFSTDPLDLIPFVFFFRRVFRQSSPPTKLDSNKPVEESAKHRPKVAGGEHGQNLPLHTLRCLSDWVSVLESRDCVPGSTTGGMLGCIAAFEDSLAALERILTTPLPFVYSVHIRHTVWVYLIFLPFQLLGDFGWYTIPGVAIAAFIYSGFLAAGEEIEQPFGYDENDLDLDLFCRVVIHEDIEHLKRTPCFNSYEGGKGISGTVVETLQEDGMVDDDDLLGFLH